MQLRKTLSSANGAEGNKTHIIGVFEAFLKLFVQLVERIGFVFNFRSGCFKDKEEENILRWCLRGCVHKSEKEEETLARE